MFVIVIEVLFIIGCCVFLAALLLAWVITNIVIPITKDVLKIISKITKLAFTGIKWMWNKGRAIRAAHKEAKTLSSVQPSTAHEILADAPRVSNETLVYMYMCDRDIHTNLRNQSHIR